jgi:apolipoprotein N-acyltransferase
LINSVFRAVETKLPLVRAANTGVTCFIDRLGRVTSILADPETGSTFIEGVLTGEINVPVEPPLTFYSRYGELFSILCLVGTILSLRTRLVRHRKPLARLLPSDPPASVR